VVPQRVLAGSLGCRSRRATLGPHSGVGSSLSALEARLPARVQAKGCSLVDGRRSGHAEAAALDEAAVGAGLASGHGGLGFGRLVASGATEGVRGYVAGSACGRQHRRREVPLGGAVDRSARQDRAALPLTRISVLVDPGCGNVEAGGSPSSAPPPGSAGNRRIRGVLVSWVGCRSRREASFSRHTRATWTGSG
jgi:hypothetical protein